MSRLGCFLASASVALAASAVVNCDPNTCSSCVGAGTASVCVNYTAPPVPNCLSCTGTQCSVNACTSGCATACYVCADLGAAGVYVSTCVYTTQAFGYVLSAQSAFDAGLSLNVFAQANPTSVTVDSTASGTIAANSVVTLSGSAAIPTLTLQGSSSQTTFVEVNSSATVTAMTASVGTSKVDTTNCSALVVSTLSVPGSTISFFQSCDTTGSQAAIVIPNIQFSGSSQSTILISGGSATLGVDANGNAGSSSGTGTINLAGGVSVYGNLSAGVTLGVVTAGKSAPMAVVDAGKALWFWGTAVTGASASFVVNGALYLGAQVNSVQTQLVIGASASAGAAANVTISSANGLTAAGWSLAAQGKVVFTAECDRSKVLVHKIDQCLGTVQIHLNMTASAFIAAGNQGIGFTYDSSNNVQVLTKCNVVIVDSTGASAQLTSVAGASASGRRLLASSGQANWGPNSMTFAMAQQQSGASSLVTIPIVIISVLGAMFN